MAVCIWYFLFDFVILALINSSDPTMQFLLHTPIDALLAVEVSHKEYLLVFTSKSRNATFLHNLLRKCCTCFMITVFLLINRTPQ